MIKSKWFYISILVMTAGLAPVMASINYQGVLLNPVKTIQSHDLIDTSGKKIAFPAAEGKYQLVFFGYTSCPDVCPMTLHKIKEVIQQLGKHDEVKYYFISIDGDRDKPQQIKEFVEYFHPDIRGLTGDVYNIKQVEKEFGILTRKFQGKSAFAYKLEHSVFMYLLDREGKLMIMYPGSTTTAQLTSDLKQLLAVPGSGD